MPSIQFNIINQLQTPAFYASSLATRPNFGFLGRIFIDTDSPSTGMYRDTGAAWIKVAGTGTATGSGTNGQVTFWNGASSLSGSNNLFWDNTNSYLGINVTTPGSYLDIHGTLNQLIQLNNTSTLNSAIAYQNQSVTKWRVGNFYNTGANDFVIFDATNTLSRVIVKNNGTFLIGQTVDSGYLLDVAGTGRFTGNVYGNTIFSIGDSALASPNQFQITGTTNTNKQLVIGLNTTLNYGCIQPTLFGTGYYPLCLNPLGANVILGSFTDNGLKFQLTGSGYISANLGIGTSAPQTTLSVETSANQNTISPIVTSQTTSVTYTGLYSIRDGAGDQRGLIFQVYTANVGLNEKMRIKSSGVVNITTTQTYASNALALAGGLVAGDIYKNSVGVLSIVY